MRWILLVIGALVFVKIADAQVTSPCSCSTRSMLYKYFRIVSTSTDPETVPGYNPLQPYYVDHNNRRYVYVETCISDPNTDVRNRSDCLDIGFANGVLPVRLKFDPDELDAMYSNWISCFNMERAAGCLNEVVDRWSNICPPSSKAYVELEWQKQQSVGEFGVYASYDYGFWQAHQRAIAIAHTVIGAFADGQGGLLFWRKLPEPPAPGKLAGGIFLNMLGQWDLSTSCPCYECSKSSSYNFCQVMQHEIGHLLGMEHHMPTCPIPTEYDATMNPTRWPCDANPPSSYDCNMDLTCNDLCQFCKIHCPGQCSTVSGVFDLEHSKMAANFTVHVFPNPAYNALQVLVKCDIPTTKTCSIFDSNGKRVLMSTIQENQSVLEIDLHRLMLGKGVYFVIVDDKVDTDITRLIIY